jgi:hypothetical protein
MAAKGTVLFGVPRKTHVPRGGNGTEPSALPPVAAETHFFGAAIGLATGPCASRSRHGSQDTH